MSVSTNVPEITRALAEFIAAPEPYFIDFDPPIDLRALAAELRLLPATVDMGGCLGLHPFGEAASFAWDEPRLLRVEPDERIRNIAFHQASLKYPAMASLAPRRPPDAIDCPHCVGTNRCGGMPEKLANLVVCYCGGLGWLPRSPA